MKLHAKEKKWAPPMDWMKKYELFSNFWDIPLRGHCRDQRKEMRALRGTILLRTRIGLFLSFLFLLLRVRSKMQQNNKTLLGLKMWPKGKSWTMDLLFKPLQPVYCSRVLTDCVPLLPFMCFCQMGAKMFPQICLYSNFFFFYSLSIPSPCPSRCRRKLFLY